MGTISPNNTIYVKNLEEKVKLPALEEALREVFSAFGTILDIVAKGNLRAKGQAFIVFEDAESAATALEAVQGFELFDKAMELAYAKTPSDAVVALNGTPEQLDQHREKRLADKERRQAAEAAAAAAKAAEESAKAAAPEAEEKDAAAAAPKQQKAGGGLKSTARAGTVADDFLPPNKILFVQNLPEDYDVEALSAVFGRYEGFKEVRLVPGRPGLAFVEYAAEAGAISAKDSTSNITLGSEGKQITVTFQRQ